MENTGLRNFIWVREDRLINLAHNVRFIVQDGGAKISVHLSNASPQDSMVDVDGDAAVKLNKTLSGARLGREDQMQDYGGHALDSPQAQARLSHMVFDPESREEENSGVSDTHVTGQ